jgi:hypothetical protein
MKQRALLGYLSLITFVLTLIWLILLITGIVIAGPLETYEQVLGNVSKLDWLYYLSYLNAALMVIAATLLFTGMYLYCRTLAPAAALMGLAFVPVYATLNLFVYLSQVSIVPGLIELRQTPELTAAADLLLRQMIQQLPSSGVAFFNNVAYAILGIPSILFGWLLSQQNRRLRLAGTLLALNGFACLLGIVGILVGNDLLRNGSVLGGILFLLALIPLSRGMLTE